MKNTFKTAEEKEKIKQYHELYNQVYKQRPEYKQKQRAYNNRPDIKQKKREYNKSQKVKERRRERYMAYRDAILAKKRVYNSRPEVKLKRKERDKIYRARPDFKERERERSRKRNRSPERKAYIKEYYQRDYVISKERKRGKMRSHGDREKNLVRGRLYKQRPEIIKKRKEYNKQWYSNPEVKERIYQYNKTSKMKAWRKKYLASPMGKAKRREQHQKRRLLIRGDSDAKGIPPVSQLKILKRDSVCVYCGKKENLTFDHIVALAKNGTNNENNLVIACNICNSKKRTKDVVEWCLEMNRPVPKIVQELLNQQINQTIQNAKEEVYETNITCVPT